MKEKVEGGGKLEHGTIILVIISIKYLTWRSKSMLHYKLWLKHT